MTDEWRKGNNSRKLRERRGTSLQWRQTCQLTRNECQRRSFPTFLTCQKIILVALAALSHPRSKQQLVNERKPCRRVDCRHCWCIITWKLLKMEIWFLTICTNKHPRRRCCQPSGVPMYVSWPYIWRSRAITDTDAELFCDKRRLSSLHLHHNFKGARALVHREHIWRTSSRMHLILLPSSRAELEPSLQGQLGAKHMREAYHHIITLCFNEWGKEMSST